jgi:hypothetical protein
MTSFEWMFLIYWTVELTAISIWVFWLDDGDGF